MFTAAPRARRQRATSLPSAAQGSEALPTRSGPLSKWCPTGLLGAPQARPARTRRPPRSRAKGAAHQAVAGSAGTRQRASHGERRDSAVPAPAPYSAAGSSSQRNPRQAHLPGPLEMPGRPASPVADRHVRPSPAPGRAWHLPWRTLKIHPQHIGTQLSLRGPADHVSGEAKTLTLGAATPSARNFFGHQ